MITTRRAPRRLPRLPLSGAALLLCLLPAPAAQPDDLPVADQAAFRAMLRDSLRDRGALTVDSVLEQDEVQRACSQAHPAPAAGEVARLQAQQRAQLRFPADARYLGDWRAGEKIAQDGHGLQYTDDPHQPNGGNCYACHQLDPQEPAYGTLGPSLAGYGKRHGNRPEALREAWIHLYNAQVLTLCSIMPRFGQQGILSEQQLRDLMALLFDPASPVNR